LDSKTEPEYSLNGVFDLLNHVSFERIFLKDERNMGRQGILSKSLSVNHRICR